MGLWSRMTAWIRPKADLVSDIRHPTAWLQDWALGGRTTAGVPVSHQGAMGLAAYYACLRAISEDVAKLPLITYRRLQPRGKERATDHPLYELLHDFPNGEMESMTFRETLTHHMLAWGNGYAEIVRDGRDRARALYPIHPSRVVVRRDEEGRVVYDVHGNDLMPGSAHTAYVVRLLARDMLHVRGLGAEGLTGYSVFQFAAESLGLGLAAQQFGAAFFGNNTVLGGVLEHPMELKDEARKHLRESWQQMYGGPSKAGTVAILEEGLKYHQLGIPPEQAQYLETRNFQVNEIARWFRIPLHKIQHMEKATFSNIEEQNLEYVPDTLMPWCIRWEQQIKRKLFVDDPDHFAEHLVAGLLRGDQARRASYYKDLFGMAALSPNDIRELENMNPVEDGDNYFVAANNYQPLSAVVGVGNEDEEEQEEEEVLIPALPGRNGVRHD